MPQQRKNEESDKIDRVIDLRFERWQVKDLGKQGGSINSIHF